MLVKLVVLCSGRARLSSLGLAQALKRCPYEHDSEVFLACKNRLQVPERCSSDDNRAQPEDQFSYLCYTSDKLNKLNLNLRFYAMTKILLHQALLMPGH